MGGQSPFRWVALFRDGHTVEQTVNRPSAFQSLIDYMYGTEDPLKRRKYLIWFKVFNEQTEYIVSFDDDGDAYIALPDGKILMTEFKIRSAQLIYQRERDIATDERTYLIGFGGVDSVGKMNGRAVEIGNDGRYKVVSLSDMQRDII